MIDYLMNKFLQNFKISKGAFLFLYQFQLVIDKYYNDTIQTNLSQANQYQFIIN